MKKLSSIILLILFSIFSTTGNAAPSLNEQLPSKQQIIIDDTMNELIKAGYVLQTQETRGIITVYVLKKGDEFAGCRIERSTKKQIEKCYIIELVNNQNK
jgi:tRNA(Ile2) C34 agmatinyltransferase TiaS